MKTFQLISLVVGHPTYHDRLGIINSPLDPNFNVGIIYSFLIHSLNAIPDISSLVRYILLIEKLLGHETYNIPSPACLTRTRRWAPPHANRCELIWHVAPERTTGSSV